MWKSTIGVALPSSPFVVHAFDARPGTLFAAALPCEADANYLLFLAGTRSSSCLLTEAAAFLTTPVYSIEAGGSLCQQDLLQPIKQTAALQ